MVTGGMMQVSTIYPEAIQGEKGAIPTKGMRTKYAR
jgi:hypothetical protein